MYNKIKNEDYLKHIAGRVLSQKNQPQIIKSIAGSALKCFGDIGVPSKKVVEFARQIDICHIQRFKNNKIHNDLVNGILNFSKIKNH